MHSLFYNERFEVKQVQSSNSFEKRPKKFPQGKALAETSGQKGESGFQGRLGVREESLLGCPREVLPAFARKARVLPAELLRANLQNAKESRVAGQPAESQGGLHDRLRLPQRDSPEESHGDQVQREFRPAKSQSAFAGEKRPTEPTQQLLCHEVEEQSYKGERRAENLYVLQRG